MPHYSVENGDRGEVRLDGLIIPFVIQCDTDEGWIECLDVPLTVVGGEVKRRILKGNVDFTRFVKGEV